MTEEWRVISEFPNYSVSSEQRIKNNKTGRILSTNGRTSINLYSGSRSSRVSKSPYSLYLQYFDEFPAGCRARTKIRVLETGNVYYGYREVCRAIGVSEDRVDHVCWAVYSRTKAGEKRSVNGYHFELVD